MAHTHTAPAMAHTHNAPVMTHTHNAPVHQDNGISHENRQQAEELQKAEHTYTGGNIFFLNRRTYATQKECSQLSWNSWVSYLKNPVQWLPGPMHKH